MKRKLAGLLAALLVLSMGTTVYAATSPTAEDIKAQAANAAAGVSVNATDSNGNNIQITQTPMSTDEYSKTLDKVEQLGSSTELLGAVDLEVPDDYIFGDSITVTLSISGITSSDSPKNIRVLHYNENTNTWENIQPNAVNNGKVTVTLKSLSPVAVVRTAESDVASGSDSNTESGSKTRTTTETSSTDATRTSGNNTNGSNTNTSNTGSSSSGGNTQTNNNNQTVNVYTTGNGTSASAQPSASTSTTSPKTGASLPALPILAVLAVMGIAVCGKKARSLS
jgi:hypothetical protein